MLALRMFVPEDIALFIIRKSELPNIVNPRTSALLLYCIGILSVPLLDCCVAL